MTDADDEYEVAPDDLAERLGAIDETAAERRAEALRQGLEGTRSRTRTASSSSPATSTTPSPVPARRCPCSRSWGGRTSASPRS